MKKTLPLFLLLTLKLLVVEAAGAALVGRKAVAHPAETDKGGRRSCRFADKLKGRRTFARRPFEHGQRPDAPARETIEKARLSSPERAEPTPLLNHETSDHLLSLVDGEIEDESSRIGTQDLF